MVSDDRNQKPYEVICFRHYVPKTYDFIWFCNGPDQKPSLLTDLTIEQMRNYEEHTVDGINIAHRKA